MGIAYNVAIVRDNLVLCLDAANPKNYNLTEVEVLVVAGGGAGGNGTGTGYESGGGGAGGLIYSSSHPITPGSAITATVGAGGAGGTSSSNGTNGGNSVFGALTAIGGGGGASSPAGGSSGGSGGGGSHNQTGGGSGTAGQGFSGATPAQGSSGGGGGGAGGPGKSTSSNADGSGGIGLPFSISGSLQYYAGGGGGSRHTNVSGGLGGGGAGVSLSAGYANGSSALPNTGGGGGGANQPATNTGGGSGGSGIIIVRYQGPQKAIGGTITSNNGYTIHTFTTSSTFTPLVATNNSAILGLSDFSGGGNFGTSVNGPTYSSANGGSISFDGVDDGVNIPHNSNIDIRNQITIECLFYLNSFTPGGADPDRITLITKSYSYYMTINLSGKIDTYFYGTGGYYSSNSSVNLNQWTHVVVTFNGSTINWYINGIIDKSLSQSGTITPERNGDLGIGREVFENYGRGMNGRISRASLYNRALSAAEIQQNYNALKGRYEKGGIGNPFSSPTEARILGYTSGDYYFKSGSMSSPQLLEFQRDYYENRGWVCVFRSPYRSTATTNRIDLNITMGGLLVQRDALDLRAAVYWSTPITYNTVGGVGNNTADSGYSPRRVILGGSGGHGIFATNQQQCNWGSATGAIGAGWDGSTCGSFPNDLVWGTGRSDTATYENRSGIWSHWITWN